MRDVEQWVAQLDERGTVVVGSLNHLRCSPGMRNSEQYSYLLFVRNEQGHEVCGADPTKELVAV